MLLCLQIVFDNKAHSGKIKIYFDTEAKIEECKNLNISGTGKYEYTWAIAFLLFYLRIIWFIWTASSRNHILSTQLYK